MCWPAASVAHLLCVWTCRRSSTAATASRSHRIALRRSSPSDDATAVASSSSATPSGCAAGPPLFATFRSTAPGLCRGLDGSTAVPRQLASMYLTRRPAAAAAAVTAAAAAHPAPGARHASLSLYLRSRRMEGSGRPAAPSLAIAGVSPATATAATAARCFSHQAAPSHTQRARVRSLHSHSSRLSSEAAAAVVTVAGDPDAHAATGGPADAVAPSAPGARPSKRLNPTAAALLRLARLRDQYLSSYPSKNVQLRSGMEDVTLKSHWRRLQAKARKELVFLTERAQQNSFKVTWEDLEQLLMAVKRHRLYDLTMPLYDAVRMQQRRRNQNKQHQELQATQSQGNTTPAAEHSTAPGNAIGAQSLRMPSRCIAMLLECVSKSPLGQSANDNDEAGGEGDADAAESLLWSMRALQVRDQFDCDTPAPWNVVLHSLTASVQPGRDRLHTEDQLLRAHAFYNAIPFKDAVTHSVLLQAYQRVGMHTEADELRAAILADPESSSVPAALDGAYHSMTPTRLTSIYDQLALSLRVLHQVTAAGHTLVEEAEALWRHATFRPRRRLHPGVTGAMLKIHHLLGNVERQEAIIQEALRLETEAMQPDASATIDATPATAGADAESNAAPAPAHTDALDVDVDTAADDSSFSRPIPARAGPPVFVDAACYGLLLESYATYAPATRVDSAHAAFNHMVQRHASAVEQGEHERAQLLWVSDAARSTYLKFVQRTQPETCALLWNDMTRDQKEGNPRAFVAALNALSRADSSAAAEALVAEYDSLRVPWSVQTFNAWLGCYEMHGEWEAAEAAWGRLDKLRLAPSATSYRKLIQVLIADGAYDQLAKVEPLYKQMKAGGKGNGAGDAAGAASTPLRFSSHDYAMLIKTSLRCGLGAEAHKWAQRARAEGLL